MSTSNKICNDGASKSNDDGVYEVEDMLHNMSTADDNNNDGELDICANCGKEGTNLNICNRCKMVMYCNAVCKKKHRSKHKKKCGRRVAELRDKILFKQPPTQYGDCAICFLRLPSLETGNKYAPCCGKIICDGCSYANALRDENKNKQLCAFCRTPASENDGEAVERLNKRVEAGDSEAIYMMGVYYATGENGFTQNYAKALELWHRAGDLGNAAAYLSIGNAYYNGRGVEFDMMKANYYYGLAAIRGNANARNNLGCMEEMAGNLERAIKHYMIAVESGHTGSLKTIKLMYEERLTTKDEYTQALRSYQEYLNEVKSTQRDEAAAAHDEYKYY